MWVLTDKGIGFPSNILRFDGAWIWSNHQGVLIIVGICNLYGHEMQKAIKDLKEMSLPKELKDKLLDSLPAFVIELQMRDL